jgi:hypothetical protein
VACLGGTVIIEEDVEKCVISKYSFQWTPGYTAPELLDSQANIIDLKKSAGSSKPVPYVIWRFL